VDSGCRGRRLVRIVNATNRDGTWVQAGTYRGSLWVVPWYRTDRTVQRWEIKTRMGQEGDETRKDTHDNIHAPHASSPCDEHDLIKKGPEVNVEGIDEGIDVRE